MWMTFSHSLHSPIYIFILILERLWIILLHGQWMSFSDCAIHLEPWQVCGHLFDLAAANSHGARFCNRSLGWDIRRWPNMRSIRLSSDCTMSQRQNIPRCSAPNKQNWMRKELPLWYVENNVASYFKHDHIDSFLFSLTDWPKEVPSWPQTQKGPRSIQSTKKWAWSTLLHGKDITNLSFRVALWCIILLWSQCSMVWLVWEYCLQGINPNVDQMILIHSRFIQHKGINYYNKGRKRETVSILWVNEREWI